MACFRAWMVGVGTGAAVAALASQAAWAEPQLPSTLSWTAYNVGSAGYNQAVGIGSALKNRLDVDLRVVPGGNDVARQTPVRTGRVQFSAQGLAAYFSQEGVFEFAARDWGPQPVRILMLSISDANLSIGTAADADIETLQDLRGKRVAWVVGAPALNVNIEVLMHFAGLTWDDVERVDFPGFSQSWEGLVNDQVDAAWASTHSGLAYQAASSPRGLYWPPVPHDDEQGWERIYEVGPWFQPNFGTEGANLSVESPHEGATYPYPILMAYADQDEELVYNMTMAMVELYEDYADTAPGNTGWAMERQNFTWVVPYHEGAIRYFEEIGVWTDDMQEHNDILVERQTVLQAAWDEYIGRGVEDEQEWMRIRAEALEQAGMTPVFR